MLVVLLKSKNRVYYNEDGVHGKSNHDFAKGAKRTRYCISPSLIRILMAVFSKNLERCKERTTENTCWKKFRQR